MTAQRSFCRLFVRGGHRRRNSSAFSLLEVMVALAILSVGLVLLMQVQARSARLAIEAREQFIAANPGTPESESYAVELGTLKQQRAEIALEAARLRVEQNPTDLQLRFELGEILADLSNWQEAIPELQKARQNPNVRMRAMSLLGQCFTARGMLDLAAKTLSDAVAELMVMDAVKKDAIYNLGLVYEKMGNAEKSVDCMKQIYEVDYGYRDVAQRVESSY